MMPTGPSQKVADVSTRPGINFQHLGGYCAVLAAVGSLLYSVAFVILKNAALYSVLLLVGGILGTVVMTALYVRLRETDAALALLGLLFGAVAALGSAAHGAYDLAGATYPSATATAAAKANEASQIDPRGFLTFGVTGLALLLFSYLITRGGALPHGLGILGIVLGVLLVEIYLGRLIIVLPTSSLGTVLILAPAALVGLIVNPVFNLWLGLSLLRSE